MCEKGRSINRRQQVTIDRAASLIFQRSATFVARPAGFLCHSPSLCHVEALAAKSLHMFSLHQPSNLLRAQPTALTLGRMFLTVCRPEPGPSKSIHSPFRMTFRELISIIEGLPVPCEVRRNIPEAHGRGGQGPSDPSVFHYLSRPRFYLAGPARCMPIPRYVYGRRGCPDFHHLPALSQTLPASRNLPPGVHGSRTPLDSRSDRGIVRGAAKRPEASWGDAPSLHSGPPLPREIS